MKVYFTVDENGFVNNGWSSTPSFAEGEIELELDKDHEFFQEGNDCYAFRYVNGQLIKDEERQKQLIEKRKREENKPSQLDMLALAVMELTEIVLGKEDK